jgi:hypothetical protein
MAKQTEVATNSEQNVVCMVSEAHPYSTTTCESAGQAQIACNADVNNQQSDPAGELSISLFFRMGPQMDALRIALWLRTSLLLIVAVVVLAAPVAAQQRPQTTVEKVAEMLSQALKAATGKARPQRLRNVVPMQMAQPVQQEAPAPAANEVQQRASRLQAYAAAMQAWITQQAELTPDQVQQFSASVEKAIEASQAKFQQAPRAHQQLNQQLSDYFPICFTAANGAAREIDVVPHQSHQSKNRELDLFPDDRQVKNIQLTPEQRQQLLRAIEARFEFREQASLQHVLNLLDAELYLTADQRQQMGEGIAGMIDRDASCFSFQPTTYYFPQTSIARTIKPGPHLQVLTEAQQDRAKDLASMGSGSYNSEQYILFQSTEGVDTWQDKLTEASTEQRKRLTRAMDVRVAFHGLSQALSDQEIRHLRVAGKGAVEEVLAAWKEQSRRQLKSYEDQVVRFNGNFSFGLNVADVYQLESNSIWKHAVESLTQNDTDALASRHNVRLDATARFVVAMLDRELWLNADQRQALLDAVKKELPDPDYRIANHRYYGEVTLLAIPLFKLSKTDLAILSPAQQKAWDAMQGMFQHDGNFVRVQMKNGGQMAFSLPSVIRRPVRENN